MYCVVALNPKSGKWLHFNDAKVTEVGQLPVDNFLHRPCILKLPTMIKAVWFVVSGQNSSARNRVHLLVRASLRTRYFTNKHDHSLGKTKSGFGIKSSNTKVNDMQCDFNQARSSRRLPLCLSTWSRNKSFVTIMAPGLRFAYLHYHIVTNQTPLKNHSKQSRSSARKIHELDRVRIIVVLGRREHQALFLHKSLKETNIIRYDSLPHFHVGFLHAPLPTNVVHVKIIVGPVQVCVCVVVVCGGG